MSFVFGSLCSWLFLHLSSKKIEIQRGLQTNGVLSGPLNNLHSQVSITNYTKVPIPNPIISENWIHFKDAIQEHFMILRSKSLMNYWKFFPIGLALPPNFAQEQWDTLDIHVSVWFCLFVPKWLNPWLGEIRSPC